MYNAGRTDRRGRQGRRGGVELDRPRRGRRFRTGYEVLRAQGSAELATLAADTGNTDTTYTDSGLTGDLDDYRYQVKALRGGDASQGSNVAGVLQSAHAGAIVPLADVTLVSNENATVGTSNTASIQAQSFVTGTNAGGYTLSEIQIRLGDSSVVPGVTGVIAAVKADDSGAPGTLVANLVNPASLTADAFNAFTAPAGTTLAANTTYWVVMNEERSSISDRVRFFRTEDDDEDIALTGWSIGDGRRWKDNASDASWSNSTASNLIIVKGTVTGGTTNNAATGAPTITGTPEVGELLTADTSGIADPDGIADADFEYQWIANDGTTDSDISGATGETYRPLLAHVGQTIKVRVTFDDDNDNAESLTSAATAAVTASTYGQVIWAATLTVEEETVAAGTFFGYSIAGRGSLEPNSFTHDRNARGSSTVTGLQYLEGGTLRLDWNGSLGSEDFNLYLDGAPFLIESPGTIGAFDFEDHGISWTDEHHGDPRVVEQECVVQVVGHWLPPCRWVCVLC